MYLETRAALTNFIGPRNLLSSDTGSPKLLFEETEQASADPVLFVFYFLLRDEYITGFEKYDQLPCATLIKRDGTLAIPTLR